MLYQKDGDTQIVAPGQPEKQTPVGNGSSSGGNLFPLTEIKRALRCFSRRADLAGMEPDTVLLNPCHIGLVQPADLEALGLRLEFDPQIGRHYIWLTIRKKDEE